MLDTDRLSSLYTAWRARYAERDVRMDVMERVIRGEFDVFDPDEEGVDSKSPNLIQVALEDTSEAASLIPTVRVQPAKGSKESKKTAQKMENIAASYMDANGVDLLIPRAVMDMAAFGFSVWTVTPDFEQNIPLVERRDPRHCYPEPGFKPGDTVRRCMFAREVFYTQLPADYQQVVADYSSPTRTPVLCWLNTIPMKSMCWLRCIRVPPRVSTGTVPILTSRSLLFWNASLTRSVYAR